MVNPPDLFSRRIYVIGEVMISTIVLSASYFMLYQSHEIAAQNAASVSLGAVLAFWFQRRQGEQAVNAVSGIADGKLTAMSDRMASLESATMAHMALQTTSAMRTAQQTEVAQ